MVTTRMVKILSWIRVNIPLYLHLEQTKQKGFLDHIGRYPIIDKDTLIECLVSRRVKGALLHVQSIEPLCADNLLWDLDNVLSSPPNMDQRSSFLSKETTFFVNNKLCLFL